MFSNLSYSVSRQTELQVCNVCNNVTILIAFVYLITQTQISHAIGLLYKFFIFN